MADLVAIVRATRASANALARMQRYARKLEPLKTMGNRPEVKAAYERAHRDYKRAQRTLADNPLSGNR